MNPLEQTLIRLSKLDEWTGIFFALVCALALGVFLLKRRRADRKKPQAPSLHRKLLHPFDLDYALLNFSPVDPFTLEHLLAGVHVFGQNGAGKTTSSGRAILRAMMRAGYGGLILIAKADEYARIKQYAEETGCSERLIRIAPDEKWRLNFLAYEQMRPGGGQTENIVRLLSTGQEAMERSRSRSGGNENPYFKLSTEQMTRNAVDLHMLATPQEKLSIDKLHKIIMSAPQDVQQLQSEAWLEASHCNTLLDEALARRQRQELSKRQGLDLDLVGNYWYKEFPQLAPETRSSIISTFTSGADPLMRGRIADLFSTGLNIAPEIIQEGGIIVVDLSLKTHGHIGLIAQMLTKHLVEESIERRDISTNQRPVFIFADEAHLFVNEPTVSFATTARSSLAATVFLSQSIPNYYWALGGEDKGKSLTDSLMGVLNTRIFHATTCPVTTRWAADVFAQSWQGKSSAGKSEGDEGKNRDHLLDIADISIQRTAGRIPHASQRRPGQQPSVDAIIGQGGRIRNASGERIRTSFSQKVIDVNLEKQEAVRSNLHALAGD